MLTLPPAVKLLACTEPVDFRKSFAGLALLVRSVMGMAPLSGHIFCFFNGRRGSGCSSGNTVGSQQLLVGGQKARARELQSPLGASGSNGQGLGAGGR